MTKSFLAALASFLFAITISAHAQTFTTLATLTTNGNGENPLSPLVQGFDGNLYGTTFGGGPGFGTFFQLTLSGTLTPLYSFCQNYNDNYACPDGAYPQGLVALGTDGNFYGVTQGGYYSSTGNGTVYKITPAGALTTLHTFCALTGCADGEYPTLGLTLARSGNFYGLSNAPEDSSAYYGQAFEISSSGAFHDVLTVCPNTLCPADAGPIASLLLSSSGAFVGPGPGAGDGSSPGALYSMSASGVPTLIYSFCDDSTCHDGGGYNRTPMAQSSTGEIYGTFAEGGAGAYCNVSGTCGTAFEVATTGGGSFTKLHDFCSEAGCADGANPGALILASDGNYYGTTLGGGKHGYGTLFRITSAGHFAVVHNFSTTDGRAPTGIALLQGTDGNLYGATDQTIYRVSLGLAPFVKTVMNSGRVGDTVIILGNNLTGSTGVTFKGIAAAFTVVSDTEITATVPSGATTGTIKVVTPTATLLSNVAFQVLQ
jgi:uncharacterized repeat protein (TIGR03803 family)